MRQAKACPRGNTAGLFLTRASKTAIPPHLGFRRAWNDASFPRVEDRWIYGTFSRVDVMLNAIAAFFRSLFAPKADDYKALLIADLGIER